jgi:hypothetical protein
MQASIDVSTPNPPTSTLGVSRLHKTMLPMGLGFMGVACLLGLSRFLADGGWALSLAAGLCAAVFLAVLAWSQRQDRQVSANLASLLCVLLLSVVFWSAGQQLRVIWPTAVPMLFSESLTLLSTLVLLWIYRLPALVGLVSIGIYIMVLIALPELITETNEQQHPLKTFFPIWMGLLNWLVAVVMDMRWPQLRIHAGILHLIAFVLIESGVMLAMSMMWLPLWVILTMQVVLFSGSVWLRRWILAAILLTITTIQVFLYQLPSVLGVASGWDLLAAAVGVSLLLCYSLWHVLLRPSAWRKLRADSTP